MGLRVCMVTPFAWSQPHPVNEHVAGAAEELRAPGARGGRPRAVGPRRRRSPPAGGRSGVSRRRGHRSRAFVALAPAIQVSRREPVSASPSAVAGEPLAGALGRQLRRRARRTSRASRASSYLALAHRRDAHGRDVPLHRAPRLPAREAPARKAPRAHGRSDRDGRRGARGRAAALARRLPPDSARRRHRALQAGEGAESGSCSNGAPTRSARAAAAIGALAELPGWELVVLRTRALTGRPRVPRRAAAPREGCRARSTPRPAPASSPAQPGSPPHSAARAGPGWRRQRPASRSIDPPGAAGQPELVGRGDGAPRRGRDVAREAVRGRAPPGGARERSRPSATRWSAGLPRRRRPQAHPSRRPAEPLADRPARSSPTSTCTPSTRTTAPSRRRAPRPGRGDRPRRDRDHRPQRLHRRAGGRRARARPRPDRHPGRGGQDRRPAR